MKRNPKLAKSSTKKSQTPDEDFPIVGIGASAGGLRKRAEDALQGKTEEQQELSIRDARSLIHELQLHQIELEMQNEELRRAQKELEESRDRYSDLYDFAPVGYFSFDKNGLIIEVNLTGAKKLGVERNFLIKKPFSLFISPGSKDVFYLHLRQVFRTGVRQTCNLKLVDKKGVQLDVQLESLSVQEGNSGHCMTAMSNITEGKLAEEVSQEARKYAESIIDTVREPFVILDKGLKVLSANRSFYSTFKVTPDETVGNLIYDIGNRQWDIPSLRTLLEEILQEKTQFNNYEVSHKFQAIGQKIMLLNARQIYQEVIGTPVILLAIEDITERKKLELLHLENERLITAAKARSEFLTIMNHELRTPLTSVIGYSIILEGKTQGELNEKQRFFVDNILKSSKYLLDLINNFLELAKTESGKQEMVFEEISVPDAINEIFKLIQENALDHNIILRKEFDPEMLSIQVDRRALKQMLFNLLSNAIKFSKKEGGIITVSTKRENDMVKISVADTGIGIKEEDIPRLFQKFEQLDSGISRKYDGSGLGLAITKQLVDMHGGKIWVESKYGEGSNFIFLLPIGGKK
ncbi:MAG: PAS domain-containing sensor histidine kinase [Euryarchaeota archaeon]|nr:PAS domain-containing sensor histidine kinase [Euryarchaeota archaeon]